MSEWTGEIIGERERERERENDRCTQFLPHRTIPGPGRPDSKCIATSPSFLPVCLRRSLSTCATMTENHRAYQPYRPAASLLLSKKWDDASFDLHRTKVNQKKNERRREREKRANTNDLPT